MSPHHEEPAARRRLEWRLRSGRGEMLMDHRSQWRAPLVLSAAREGVVEGSGPQRGQFARAALSHLARNLHPALTWTLDCKGKATRGGVRGETERTRRLRRDGRARPRAAAL